MTEEEIASDFALADLIGDGFVHQGCPVEVDPFVARDDRRVFRVQSPEGKWAFVAVRSAQDGGGCGEGLTIATAFASARKSPVSLTVALDRAVGLF